MFEIGLGELLLVCIVALLVLGPERLPEAIRTTTRLLHQLRTGFTNLKREIEREIGTDELKRDLHNQAIMRQLQDTGDGLGKDIADIRKNLSDLEYDIKQEATKPDSDNRH